MATGPISAADSDVSTTNNSVFIDTSLNTHLAVIVSQHETISDLKKRIMYEHPLCFPSVGDIKIEAIKVKRRGCFYHLSDSVFVKSAFVDEKKKWFLYVDASSAEGPSENRHSTLPDSSTMNKSLAGGNNILIDGPLKACVNPDDLLLPQLDSIQLVKQKVGTSESCRKVPKDRAAAVALVDSQHKVSSAISIRSAPNKLEKCFQLSEEKEVPEAQTGCLNENIRNEDNTERCDRPLETASKPGTSTKRKCMAKRKIDGEHYHDLRENNVSVSTSYDNSSHQEVVIPENPLGNKGGEVSYGMQIGKDITDGQCRTLGTLKDKTDVLPEMTVPEEELEIEYDMCKNYILNEQSNNSLEDTSQSNAVAKKRRKRKSNKKKVDEDSLNRNRGLVSDPKEGIVTAVVVDEEHRKSFDDTLESRPNVDKKHDKSKETSVDPSSGKDVRQDKGVVMETNPNDLGRKSECGQGAPTSETSAALRKKRKHDYVQEVSELFRSPGADSGSVKSKEGASDITIVSAVGRLENLKDHQKPDNPKKDAAVFSAGVENIIHGTERRIEPLQNNDCKDVLSGKGEATSGAEKVWNTEEAGFTSKSLNVEETVVPDKSSTKKRNYRADKDSVGVSLLTSGPDHLKGCMRGISLIDPHQAVIEDHSCKKAKKDESDVPSMTAQKVPQKKTVSADLATDREIDDVIKNVVESVGQVNGNRVTPEILGKKLRKKSKKRKSSAKDAIEFLTDVETSSQTSLKLYGKQRSVLRTPAGDSGSVLPQESSFRAKNDKVLAIGSKKKSLLGASCTIFKDESIESSDNKDGGQDSDASTKTPLDNSASDWESNANVNSPLIGNGESQGTTELAVTSVVGKMGNVKDHHMPNNLKKDIEVMGDGVERVIINNREECRMNEAHGVEWEIDLLSSDHKAVTSEICEQSCTAKEETNNIDVVRPDTSLDVNNVDCKKSSKKKRRSSENEDLVGGAQLNSKVVVSSKSLDANETVYLGKSAKEKKGTRTTGDFVSRTPVASSAENGNGSMNDISRNESHKVVIGDHSSSEGKKQESKMPVMEGQKVSNRNAASTCDLSTDKNSGDGIQSVMESVLQIRKNRVNSENMDEESSKKCKRSRRRPNAKNLTECQKENKNVGPRVSVSSTNTRGTGALCNVAKQTELVETGSMNQLNGPNVEYEKDMNAVIVKGPQVSLHSLEDINKDKPLQAVVDGDPPNNSCACEATSEVFVDKMPKEKGENKSKSKKNKTKLDAHSYGHSSPDSQGSLKVNGELLKTQTGNSGTTLSQEFPLKDEFDNVPLNKKNKSPKRSEKNDARVLPSKKSDKLNSIPEEVKRPAVVKVSQTISRSVKKGGSQTLSTSSLESSKMLSAHTRKDNGGEPPADLHPVALRKESGNRVGHYNANSSEHKKGLLAISGEIFKDDTDLSSEGGGIDSDASTRTPSDNSSDGEINSNQLLRGRDEDSGEIIKSSFSASAKGLTFEDILRKSRGFKKALTLRASQEDPLVGVVPDSQPNL